MKTVKKLLSLMLVAILLVSAVPFQASAAGDGEYSVQTIVYNYSTDEALGSWTESYTVTEAEAQSIAGFQDASWAADAIAGTAYADTTKYTPVSMVARIEGSVLVCKVYVRVLSSTTETTAATEAPTQATEPAPAATEPIPEETVGKCNLTIKYNLTGYADNTVKATIGSLYKNYVGVPARGGYDFLGWYSDDYGRLIDVTKDIIRGDDTISGLWSSAKEFNLTLDENRGAEETVNYGVKVTYGENIWAKVSKYNPTREGYVFMGWKLNGKMIDKNTVWDLQDDATAYAQWKLESDTEGEPMGGNGATADGKVYLEIYLNDDTAHLAKRVDITSYAADNKITRAEAEAVVKKYYAAKSGYTLKYIGLFDEEGWWYYTRDPETDGKDSIIVNRDGDDYVYVMVNNVKVTVADPSNPKTGDGILAVVATMFTTGGAALFLEQKKRKL